MAKSLVIVESPAKAKTLSRFLGRDYQVEASFGHIRDLPENADEVPEEIRNKPWGTLGVDTDGDFTPVLRGPGLQEAARHRPEGGAEGRLRTCCWRPTPTARASRSAGT